MITSIGEIPTAAAQVYGDKTVLVCEDRSLSFSELDALSNKLASALIGLGVQVGDRVTLYSPNCWEWVVSYYGILKTGAVVNPINVMLTPSEVEFIANDCGASVVIASYEKAMSIQNVKESSDVLELIAFGDELLPDGMLAHFGPMARVRSRVVRAQPPLGAGPDYNTKSWLRGTLRSLLTSPFSIIKAKVEWNLKIIKTI